MPGAAQRTGAPLASFLIMISIAVSAVVKPSRVLRLALHAYAALNLAVAVALAWQMPGGVTARGFPALLAGAACAMAAILAFSASKRLAKVRRIDLSGLGEIRLTVQQSMGVPIDSNVLHLLPGSTIWPHCLLLLLRAQADDAISVLIILPDSLAPGTFRVLAVALRAIAGRDKQFVGNNEIL